MKYAPVIVLLSFMGSRILDLRHRSPPDALGYPHVRAELAQPEVHRVPSCIRGRDWARPSYTGVRAGLFFGLVTFVGFRC